MIVPDRLVLVGAIRESPLGRKHCAPTNTP